MTIGQVSQASGVARSTIRYFEKVGVLPAALRTNGVRRYDEEAVNRLTLIRFARSAGISIRDLATIASTDRTASRNGAWKERCDPASMHSTP